MIHLLNITELFDIQDCFEYTGFKFVNRNKVQIEFSGQNSFLYKVIPIEEFEEVFDKYGDTNQLMNDNRFNFSTEFLNTYFGWIFPNWLLLEKLTEDFVLEHLNDFDRSQW